jgi:hypothetical protein
MKNYQEIYNQNAKELFEARRAKILQFRRTREIERLVGLRAPIPFDLNGIEIEQNPNTNVEATEKASSKPSFK